MVVVSVVVACRQRTYQLRSRHPTAARGRGAVGGLARRSPADVEKSWAADTDGQVQNGSDLDLAVRGCPSGQFFRAHGTLMMELDHPVDLVDLDQRTPFVRHLERHGELLRLTDKAVSEVERDLATTAG